jgi:acetyltransferase-like isoleucine patch superfamily enzyme
MGSISVPGVKIAEHTKIEGIEKIEFGHGVVIDDFVFIHAKKKMKIGNHVHIGCFSFLNGGEEITIDDFVEVSVGCRVFTDSVDLEDWGLGSITVPEEYRNVTYAPVQFGKFVFISANSTIMPGVTIGEGATVKPCSVVTLDLNPWGVYFGNKKVGQRDERAVMETYRKYISDTSGDIRRNG